MPRIDDLIIGFDKACVHCLRLLAASARSQVPNCLKPIWMPRRARMPRR